MKAQSTFEFLLSFLIFLTVISILLTPILNYFVQANNSIHNSKTSQSLSAISLNLAFLYLSTQSLETTQNQQELSVYLQKNIIQSNNSFSYTLNPAKGAAYGQNSNQIPQ